MGSLGDLLSLSPLCKELEVLCICCLLPDLPSLLLSLGMASRGRFHLFLFFRHFKRKTERFLKTKRTFSHFVLRNLSDSDSVILADYLSAEDFTCFFFFPLENFIFYEVVFRHRRGDLAVH